MILKGMAGCSFEKVTSNMDELSSSQRRIFRLSGPAHLTTVDWTNFDHKRSIAASLVKGVYVSEHDRLLKLEGSQANAPPWWEFFNFQLNQLLVDEVNNSIFGAIYEFKGDNHSDQNPPNYVIAFRGVIKSQRCIFRDLLELNLLVLPYKFEKSSRLKIAMQALRSKVDSAGVANIWLAGHSMGSAIALHLGKSMAKMGFSIETYLFNPLFMTSPIDLIKNEQIKQKMQFVGNVIKAKLALFTKDHTRRSRQDNEFAALSNWQPYLFVNTADYLGSGYTMYFEHRKRMVENGAGEIERLATQNSMGSLLAGVLGRDFDAIHLIPSANVTVNLSESPSFQLAHGIDQWWNPHFGFQSHLHHFS